MASYRRLSNRKWQASVVLPVRLPSGQSKRITKSHPSKGVVREWATKVESEIAAGRYVDVRAGEVTLDQLHDRWVRERLAADATVAKAESFWRNHVGPAWAGHPVA